MTHMHMFNRKLKVCEDTNFHIKVKPCIFVTGISRICQDVTLYIRIVFSMNLFNNKFNFITWTDLLENGNKI